MKLLPRPRGRPKSFHQVWPKCKLSARAGPAIVPEPARYGIGWQVDYIPLRRADRLLHRSRGGGSSAARAVVVRQRLRVKWSQVEVMVGAIDVVADEPPGGAADEDIGGKVLIGD